MTAAVRGHRDSRGGQMLQHVDGNRRCRLSNRGEFSVQRAGDCRTHLFYRTASDRHCGTESHSRTLTGFFGTLFFICEISVIVLLVVSTSPDRCDKFISGMKFTGSLPEPVSGILFNHFLRYSTDFPCRDTLFLFHNKEDTVWQTNYSSGSRLSVRGNR